MALQLSRKPITSSHRNRSAFSGESASNGSILKTFISQVATLSVDESIAKVECLSPSLTAGEVVEILSPIKQKLIGRMGKSIQKIRAKTGRQFRIDCGDLIMPRGSWFVVVTCTRIR